MVMKKLSLKFIWALFCVFLMIFDSLFILATDNTPFGKLCGISFLITSVCLLGNVLFCYYCDKQKHKKENSND